MNHRDHIRIWEIYWEPQPGSAISLVRVKGPLLDPQESVRVIPKVHYDIVDLQNKNLRLENAQLKEKLCKG